MLDTIVFQKDYSHNIIGCSELSHNDTFNISSIPYHYFICDMSFWTFEFNFDNKNKKINYFQYLNSKDIANNNSLTEICLKIVINEIDFVQKENKYILFLNDKELEYRMKSKNVQFEYSESYTPYSTAQFGGYDLEEIISFDEDSFLKITIEK
ncbi:MAG: hypothetical protein HZB41_04160 [Ignavibacteriae bacterium]|nr:hypothetical protein [Ignavibacteriota bacterium]